MRDAIPINSCMSTKAVDYMTRLPMTRRQYDEFIGRTQKLLDSSEISSLHYTKEVTDGYRGDEQCFFVFSDILRCEVGWNSKCGVYVAPVYGYALFDRKDPCGFLTVEEWFEGIEKFFRPSDRSSSLVRSLIFSPSPSSFRIFPYDNLCEGFVKMMTSF